jgi:DNA modification methylase
MSTWRILTGDVRERLADLADGSVRCCVTSPPYWGLRDYGMSGQLGLEKSPDLYTAAMVDLFRDVRRVLADDGTLWLNLGDSYAGGGNYRGIKSLESLAPKQRSNRGATGVSQQLGALGKDTGDAKAKDLVGIPWMVAFALRDDGWYLRSDIIWHKPNPMPESVTDRPTKAHEYIFLLTKSARYYYDADAIADPALNAFGAAGYAGYSAMAEAMGRHASGNEKHGVIAFNKETRNKRSVWTVTTQPYPEAHFATFPEALIEPCILAGSAIGDTVLDPFCGSGTTGVVAIRHQRNFVGIELNPQYVELARTRIGAVAPLLAQEVA